MDKDQVLQDLQEFLKIPSISAQSEHVGDMNKCAVWLQDYLQASDLENVQILPTGGHPAVYADWLHAEGQPTLLIYGHYDVQSPDPLDQWVSPPFEPTIRNGNIYARGSADDKGQIFTHITTIGQLLKEQKNLPVNIKFIIEGEEEVGGLHLEEFIAQNKDLLKADVCLISDTSMQSSTQPVIPYGLRGIVYFQLELQALDRDVHSGSYGGNVPNVAFELATLINRIKDFKTQEVLIPGFYDNVRELSAEEKTELKVEDFLNHEMIHKETGARQLVGLPHTTPAQRAGALPTLDINGMYSGYLGEGPKTIIPARASAKISMRLVPNQTAAEIAEKFTKYIEQIQPEYVNVKCELISSGEPILMKRMSIYFQKAEKVLTEVFGNKPHYVLGGGSIPVTAMFKKVLNIDSVMLGFGLPDDGLHSPNEKMSLEMFWKGIETSKKYIMAF